MGAAAGGRLLGGGLREGSCGRDRKVEGARPRPATDEKRAWREGKSVRRKGAGSGHRSERAHWFEEEKREAYELGNWKHNYEGKPYYHHPWFNWNKRERWINDREAINYWLNYRGGNPTALNEIKSKYPDDFTTKTY